jgi:hypothetical protein
MLVKLTPGRRQGKSKLNPPPNLAPLFIRNEQGKYKNLKFLLYFKETED